MNTDSVEFETVRTARDKLVVRVKEDPHWVDWFRGAGMGFTTDNRWSLHVNVKEHGDIANVEMLLRAIGYVGPYDIKAIGDIIAL